jgi:hypothetical protein
VLALDKSPAQRQGRGHYLFYIQKVEPDAGSNHINNGVYSSYLVEMNMLRRLLVKIAFDSG